MKPRSKNILAFVTEPAQELPVMGGYDVIVAGGGIAGIAAALAAARNGVSVCLLERFCALGGLATLGNVTSWLPLCDGRGRQVIGGLAEEMLKLSVADLGRDNRSAHFRGLPSCWKPGGDAEERKKVRYQVKFNPSSYLLALEKLVTNSGVGLLYDTRVCALHRDTDKITHLIVENKSGRSAIACRAVVDATGDADICFWAGEKTESFDSNVLCGWFYHLQNDALHLNKLSNQFNSHAAKTGADGPFFCGDDARQVTAQILGTRELVRKRLTELRAQHPDDEIQVLMPATMACFRMTRRLIGRLSLGEHHQYTWFEDAVALTGDWRKAGPVYAIPLRALSGVRNYNLLTVGRCISADSTAWDVTRAIPACAVTGEAAGTASALAVRLADGDVSKLSVSALQRQLRFQGVLLDPALVAPTEEGYEIRKEQVSNKCGCRRRPPTTPNPKRSLNSECLVGCDNQEGKHV